MAITYDKIIDHGSSTIQVTVSGSFDHSDVLKLTLDVGSLAETANIKRILYDVLNATPKVSILDAYNLAENAEKRGMQRGYKRALVHDGHDAIFAHFETVSLNRGFCVRRFNDLESAQQWLIR